MIYDAGAGFGAVLSARVDHTAPMILVRWQNGLTTFLHAGTVMPAESLFVEERRRILGKWTEMMKEMHPEQKPLDGGEKYQERVNAAKTEFSGLGPTPLAETYLKLRNERDEMEKVRSKLDCRIVALEQLITDSFEANGLEMVRLQGGGSVATEVEPYAAIEDPVAVRQWVVERGLESRLTLPWQTLNSETKDMLLSEGKVPPGVKLFVRTKVVKR